MRVALPLSLALPWLLAAGCAAAQPVWRCGADARSYSDRPCADGRPLQLAALADERSAAQIEQARQVAQREQRLADSLRQERLARERLDPVPRPRQDPGRRAAAKRAAGEISAKPAARPPASLPSRRAMAPRPAPAADGTSPAAARASRRDRG